MAEKIAAVEDYLTCPVCRETFREPVTLGCNHSFCYSCLENHWDQNKTKNCPVCRRKSSKGLIVNFALKNLTISFDKKQKSEVSEEQLRAELQSLQEHRAKVHSVEQAYKEIQQHSEKQLQHCECQIRAEFARLHQFLKEEQEVHLTALRKDQQRQARTMASELERIREQLSSLTQSIEDLENILETWDPLVYSRTQRHTQAPYSHLQPGNGLLINQAAVLGNLGCRVWRKMRNIVRYSPVVLDPNTANPGLCVSEDLTSVRRLDAPLQLPDNPERFTKYYIILGSEGFSAGTHQWDVKVGDHPNWILGVAKDSVNRKEESPWSPKNGFCCLGYHNDKYVTSETLPLKNYPEKIRIQLDCKKGTVSFFDTYDKSHIFTYNETFTEKFFPYFCVGPAAADRQTKDIRICPVQAPV